MTETCSAHSGIMVSIDHLEGRVKGHDADIKTLLAWRWRVAGALALVVLLLSVASVGGSFLAVRSVISESVPGAPAAVPPSPDGRGSTPTGSINTETLHVTTAEGREGR